MKVDSGITKVIYVGMLNRRANKDKQGQKGGNCAATCSQYIVDGLEQCFLNGSLTVLQDLEMQLHLA
jgi:hypothetical protein